MKKISSFILFLFSVFVISACSIYKSEGRKSFETKSPTQAASLAVQSTIQNCRNISEMALDFEANFSMAHRELLSAREGYEVWKTVLNNGQIQISEISQLENDYSVCESIFKSEEDWQNSKSEYFVNNSVNE